MQKAVEKAAAPPAAHEEALRRELSELIGEGFSQQWCRPFDAPRMGSMLLTQPNTRTTHTRARARSHQPNAVKQQRHFTRSWRPREG